MILPLGTPVANQVHQAIHDARFGRQVCNCGADLTKCDVEGYRHDDGWKLPEGKFNAAGTFWLYMVCPKCGYQWAIWKLGVERNHAFTEA